jgi:DNA-binding SARP family transcriptional activator
MAHLSLSLLGPFQAVLDEEPVAAFESNKVRALLTYLAVEADRPHSREKLAGLLWPERSDRDASANLRYALSNLRAAINDRAASPAFLLISRQTIQFNRAGDARVDVAAFAELLALPAPSISGLERAVDLYRGEFLEGFFLSDSLPFEEWVLLKREQLGRQMHSALHRLAAMYEQRGEYERALPYIWRQVELDPWQDRARQQLMRLLALSGQRAAALAQYEVFRQALAEELGVEPGRTTKELYEQIRDGKGGSDEREELRPADEAALEAASVPLSPARPRLSKRMRLALVIGSLAVLAVIVVLIFVVNGNIPFGSGVAATLTPLPGPGVTPGKGKLVHVCGELLEGPDSSVLPQICVTDYETGRRFQVTDNLAFDEISHLAWSPDGQQIVFSANMPGSSHKLYIISADGSGLRQLIGSEVSCTDPAWSPDGEWIVFTRGDALWLVRPDGSESHVLLEMEQFHLGMAAWAPDSQRIAFLQEPIERDSLLREVRVTDRDATDPYLIYAFERSDYDVIVLGWSPDGRQVGCFLSYPGTSKTLLVDADGSGEVRVADGTRDSWLPEYWSLWSEER